MIEEVIDLYKACAHNQKKRFSSKEIFAFIQQVVARIETSDTALQLNCLRLLRLLAEDHALLFVELAFLIYSKIQVRHHTDFIVIWCTVHSNLYILWNL